MTLPTTPRLRRVLVLAEQEAKDRRDDWLGVEHLALAIVREGESIPAGVLAQLGVTIENFRPAMEAVLGRPDRPPVVLP